MCMCSKSRCRSVKKKNTVKSTPKPKSARKSKARIKNRKPKYLSLSLQLSVDKPEPEPEPVPGHEDQDHDHDPDPNPENNNLVDDNVALFFSGGENSAATTLTGLLTSTSSDDKNITDHYSYTTNHPCTDTCRGSVLQERALLRTALKKKETDYREEDEKWVVYSEVVDLDQHSTVTIMKDEEVSSCCEADRKPDIDPVIDRHYYKDQKKLSLKLDYDEVLNAWSDKGSLYLDDAESPQIVPDIRDDFLAYETSSSCHGLRGGWENNGVQYRVPEIMLGSNQSVGSRGSGTEDLGVEEWKVGQREASVLRYKEKRQNRLFSKRIRYEVRKLNAQNRPRVKGRFVKRD